MSYGRPSDSSKGMTYSKVQYQGQSNKQFSYLNIYRLSKFYDDELANLYHVIPQVTSVTDDNGNKQNITLPDDEWYPIDE